jgi:hypothetical protein
MIERWTGWKQNLCRLNAINKGCLFLLLAPTDSFRDKGVLSIESEFLHLPDRRENAPRELIRLGERKRLQSA